MGIVSVATVSKAMGVTFSDQKADSVQYYIDVVSSYIEAETGVSFVKLTGDVVREEADNLGVIELTQEPVHDIDKVVDCATLIELDPVTQYCWNGLQRLSGFYPFQVVDVTLDHGYEVAPVEIVGVIVDAVRRGLATGNAPVKQQTVGDVTVIYGDLLTFSKSDLEILGRYGMAETTWGPSGRYDRDYRYVYPFFPINGLDYDGCL